MFYWMAILASNTLGTALGDFLADSSGLVRAEQLADRQRHCRDCVGLLRHANLKNCFILGRIRIGATVRCDDG